MDVDEWLRLCLFAVLVILSGVFSATETSFASVNKFRIMSLADKGDRRATSTLKLLDKYDELVSALLIGNNIVNIACSAIATAFAAHMFAGSANDSYIAITTVVVTFIIFIFGETLPKTFAKANNEKMAIGTTKFVGALCVVFKPLIKIMTAIGNLFARTVKIKEEATVTEDELFDIIDDIKEEGTMDEEKTDLVKSALLFDDKTAGDILTARVDMMAIDMDMTPEEMLAFVKECKHSRIPVFQDTEDNIIGVLPLRKYLRRYISGGDITDITDMLDAPFFTHSSTKADDLLNQMNSAKTQIAIVTDEFGGTLGLVSTEDILEELVGDIWDEDDEVIESVVQLDDNQYRVLGECPVVDFFDEIEYSDFDRDELGSKTMAAQALETLNAMPREGLTFNFYDFKGTITTVERNRILAVVVSGPTSTVQTDEEADK